MEVLTLRTKLSEWKNSDLKMIYLLQILKDAIILSQIPMKSKPLDTVHMKKWKLTIPKDSSAE